MAREAIAGGVIGTPVTSSLIWAMRKPDDYFANNWRTAHGSPVMINLIHDIDLICFVLGEIAEVAALVGTPRRDGMRVESGAIAMLMESRLSATISFADTAPSPWGSKRPPMKIRISPRPFRICGGLPAPGRHFLSVTHAMGRAAHWGEAAQPRHHKVGTVTPLAAQLDHFIKVIRGVEDPLITVEDAARSLEVTYHIEQALAGQLAS